MIIDIVIDSKELRQLVEQRLSEIFTEQGYEQINLDDIKIEVKSKQNFRVNEWESGDFKATIKVDTLSPLRKDV